MRPQLCCAGFLTAACMYVWFIFVMFVCLTFTWGCSVCLSRPWVLKDRDHLSHISRMGMLGASGQQAGHPESQEAMGREDSQSSGIIFGKSLSTSYCYSQVQKKGDRWISAKNVWICQYGCSQKEDLLQWVSSHSNGKGWAQMVKHTEVSGSWTKLLSSS